MSFIDKKLDELEEMSKPGKPLHFIWPIIEAQDTGIRVPSTRTAKGAHVRDFVNLKRMMVLVVFALIPCLLFGIYNAGYQATLAANGDVSNFWGLMGLGALAVLPIVAVSYAAGAVWEVGFAIVRGHEINEGFLVSGMLLPLILPPTTPLWMVAVGMSFGIVIGKEVFGGTGMNILNPALTARAFLFFAYPASMSGDKIWTALDGFTGASPLGIAYATTVKDGVLDALGSAGFTLQKLFYGLVPGSIGETSTLLCLFGGAVLLIAGIASWRIMLSMFLGGALVSVLIQQLAGPDSSGLMDLPFYYQLCMGGFAFGAVFMATDPVSAAGTDIGKYIYGFLTGALAITIRALNPAYPEGVMLAILFMNIFSPLIDHYVVQANVMRRLKNA